MRKIYLSFLGLGNPKSGYNTTVYELNEKKSKKTEFVQAAEMEIIGAKKFNKIFIAVTDTSYDAHFINLEKQIKLFGGNPIPIRLIEDFSPRGQWKWFEKILSYIEAEDELTIDLTHGYRSIPIIFSTAINFLQKAKKVKIDAVYYGAYVGKEITPIIDMKEFYNINEWADAVTRLVEDADARQMAIVAESTPLFQMGELNDDNIIKTLQELTNTIRNVDVNSVSQKANSAIMLIKEKERDASETGRILLQLVIDKFIDLTTKAPPDGNYNKDYFQVQLEIIKLLLEHKLYMQAYTVMREFIGSIGLIGIKKANTRSSAGRKQRNKADIFVNMVQYDEEEWKFSDEQEKSQVKIIPFYEQLKELDIISILRSFCKDLLKYRNGFDHAWTAKVGAEEGIEENGKKYFEKLSKVLFLMEKYKLLNFS